MAGQDVVKLGSFSFAGGPSFDSGLISLLPVERMAAFESLTVLADVTLLSGGTWTIETRYGIYYPNPVLGQTVTVSHKTGLTTTGIVSLAPLDFNLPASAVPFPTYVRAYRTDGTSTRRSINFTLFASMGQGTPQPRKILSLSGVSLASSEEKIFDIPNPRNAGYRGAALLLDVSSVAGNIIAKWYVRPPGSGSSPYQIVTKSFVGAGLFVVQPSFVTIGITGAKPCLQTIGFAADAGGGSFSLNLWELGGSDT